MRRRFSSYLATVGSVFVLCAFQAVVQAGTHNKPLTPATTYLEHYLTSFECWMYFTYMVEHLQEQGGPEEKIAFYSEKSQILPWAFTALLEKLSKKEMNRALQRGVQIEMEFAAKVADGHGDATALMYEFDARCISVCDNFDATTNAIAERLERESGEPYLEWKGKCVTASTEFLTATGRYDGWWGPSMVKRRSSGKWPKSAPQAGDYIALLLPVGTVAEWTSIPQGPPPQAHLDLLSMPESHRAETLAVPLREHRGVPCEHPTNPYFRGFGPFRNDPRLVGRNSSAYWAIRCEDGTDWAISISWYDNRFMVDYRCPRPSDPSSYPYPECFSPCSGGACSSKEMPHVQGYSASLPATALTRVERAPDEQCAEIRGGGGAIRQEGPPSPGRIHTIALVPVDQADCTGQAPDHLQVTLQIFGSADLNVLDIDIGSIEARGLQLDRSTGPPCKLAHSNPTDDKYADLRCRLVSVSDEILSPPTRTASLNGRFVNGAQFEGRFSVCKEATQ